MGDMTSGKHPRKTKPSPMEEQAAQISGEMYGMAKPLLQTLVPQMANAVSGNFNPASSPIYNASRGALSRQYQGARDQIMGSLPAGGGLQNALAQSFMQEAESGAGLLGNIFQDEYNRAYGFATGTPFQSAGQLSNLGAIQAQRAAAAEQASAQRKAGVMGMLGNLGMGAGYMMGGKGGSVAPPAINAGSTAGRMAVGGP